MLRYYQEEAESSILFAWEEYDRILLHLGTGGGKTVIAAHVIAKLVPARCIFIADQDELCQQPMTVIDRHAGIIPALEKADKRASMNAQVVVASAQTLAKKSRLERFPPGLFKYAIVDEAHRGSDRDKVILDHLGCKALGITATPFRANLRDLSKYYEHVAYSLPMLDLINEGFAPPLKVLRLPVEINLDEVKTHHGDYDTESLSTTIAPYYQRIAELLAQHAAKRRTICFLPLIASSQAFAAICRRNGISAVHVDGTSADRTEIIEGFKRGKFHVLCNADLVGTGVDIPIADCFVNLSPTQSAVRYQQRAGRVLRVLPEIVDDIPGKDQAEERKKRIAASAKPDSLIIDFLWQHERLNVMRPEHLVAVNEEEAQAMFEKVKKQLAPEDLLAIAKAVQEEREAKLVQRLEEVSARTPTKSMEPEALGYLFGSKELMDYDPPTLKDAEPASPQQLAKLRSWHVDAEKVTCKGQAQKLMGIMLHRFRFKLATAKQLQVLNRMGIEHNPWRITIKEASELIAMRNLSRTRGVPLELC